MTKRYAYKGRIALCDFQQIPGYSIFYHERRIPTSCCLILDNHRQLRIPVTTFNQYLRGAASDSLPGVPAARTAHVRRNCNGKPEQ